MARPPPSFSSFPDLERSDKKVLKPPSFSSFTGEQQRDGQSTSTRTDVPPARTTTTRADKFLDDLQGEIKFGLEPTGTSNRTTRTRDEGRRRRDREDDDTLSDSKRAHSRRRLHQDYDNNVRHNKTHGSSKSTDKTTRDHPPERTRSRGPSPTSAANSAQIWNELSVDSRQYGDKLTSDGSGSRRSYQLVQYESTAGQAAPPDQRQRISHASSEQPQVMQTDKKKIYYNDSKGDELNLRYGGLHRGDVPKYRRLGAGRVIGLNDGLRITRETAYTGRGVEIAPLRAYQTPRYTDKRAAQHMTNKHVKTVRLVAKPKPQRPVLGEAIVVNQLQAEQDPFIGTENADSSRFVAFEDDSVDEAARLAALEQEEGQDYRSVTGLIKPKDLQFEQEAENEGEDGAFNGLGVTGGESQQETFNRLNKEYDHALREDPKNVDKWIAFSDLQDEIARVTFFGTSTKRAFSKAERASTSEIKLSILEKALSVKGNEGSERLILAHIRAASDLWEPTRLLQHWSKVLRQWPNLTDLWIEYVSWRQTTASKFLVKDIVDVFAECFQVLSASMDKQRFRSQARSDLEANCTYLFLRLCIMLRQAGYSERATAAFQALLELNLYRPNQYVQPNLDRDEADWRREVVAGLEDFWDTEAPRVGEQGARGWRNTTENAEPHKGAADADVDDARVQGLAPMLQWATKEQLGATRNHRPARTTDPGMDDSDDPYRVVLFDDVRDLLFVVHSPESKQQLGYGFLTYLGLPFIPPDFPTSTPFSTDPFIHSELADRPNLMAKFWPRRESSGRRFDIVSGEPMELERRPALDRPYDAPFKTMPAMVDTLFSGRTGWFTVLRKEDLQDVDVDMARAALQMLSSTINDSFLTLNSFAFEACQNPKNAVKLAKSVLRDQRQNLALWDGYARIERQRGKLAEARQVYVTALSMYRSFDESAQIDGPLLWRAWAEMEWEEGDETAALNVIAAMSAQSQDLASLPVPGQDRPSSSSMLRTRQLLTAELETAFQPNVTQALLRNRNHIAFCAALFEYLSRGLPAALEVLDQHVFRLENSPAAGTAEHEEAFISYVKLVYRHSTAGKGYQPGMTRDLTERAVMAFKNNSAFLATFYHNELRMKIQNRFRRSLETLVLANKPSSENWIFAIFAELHLDINVNNAWAIRNLFDRALEEPATQASASLWSLYIEFELRNSELARAKALVYRAVQKCPWCKPLYLKPFGIAFRPVFSDVELSNWHRLMLEKGLRVRVDFRDTVGQIEDEHDQRMLDWDRDDDEGDKVRSSTSSGAVVTNLQDVNVAEDLLREREELKPY
ncbi:hypothetical protein OIO90_000825 [Microbotryomycetes sp. JL221]|nr:hypothetical protein OIO90_000825 [Microbotryomycetes sp. JL221]